jgi:spore maturation protein CgeB
MLSNGCDYAFWSASAHPAAHTASARRGNVALYQGGINLRLDFDLLERVIGLLPDWEFRFCGRLDRRAASQWKRLRRLPNLLYLGELAPAALRTVAHEAQVGIIPFVDSEMIAVSMPLKAFEYAAGSLPVVSTPIRALEKHPELFRLARNPAEFARAIREAPATRFDEKAIAARHDIARQYDYDERFAELQAWVSRFQESRRDRGSVCEILVLYDVHSIHVNTINEHLRSFSLYSRHRVRYVAATGTRTPSADFSEFDVVVIHYCVRVNLDDHLSPANVRALREYPGLKVLFIQDEYDTTETARRAIERLGIHVVYTCVPEADIGIIYPRHRFPSVEFLPTLTGFVPTELPKNDLAMRQRRTLIGYRGRSLPYWYGDLAREKLLIGQRMKEICVARGLSVDIEWDDAHRIYGEKWYRFLQGCKATLGTESGSNLFDDYGQVRAAVERATRDNPNASYEQLRPALIAPHEGRISMNQVSPRIFEAIACGTALVLFEGDYSGAVKPGLHFIPLKKDFSNVDDILARLHDDTYLEQLTERAYRDVIESGRYSYSAFVEDFDQMIGNHVRTANRHAELSSAKERQQTGGCARATDAPLSAADAAAMAAVPISLTDRVAAAAAWLWYRVPVFMRKAIRPMLNRIRSRAS